MGAVDGPAAHDAGNARRRTRRLSWQHSHHECNSRLYTHRSHPATGIELDKISCNSGYCCSRALLLMYELCWKMMQHTVPFRSSEMVVSLQSSARVGLQMGIAQRRENDGEDHGGSGGEVFKTGGLRAKNSSARSVRREKPAGEHWSGQGEAAGSSRGDGGRFGQLLRSEVPSARGC